VSGVHLHEQTLTHLTAKVGTRCEAAQFEPVTRALSNLAAGRETNIGQCYEDVRIHWHSACLFRARAAIKEG
jgi:hypothetical protein